MKKALVVLNCILLAVAIGLAVNRTIISDDNSATTPLTQMPSEKSSETATNYPSEVHPKDLKLSSADVQRYEDMTRVAYTNISFYTNNKRYLSDAAELSNYQKNRQNYRDPSTNIPYNYTDNPPARGEMQYKLGYKCASNLRGLGETASNNIYSFIVLMDDGSYMCKSNVQ